MFSLCVMSLLLGPPQCIAVYPTSAQCWTAAADWIGHVRQWQDRSHVESSSAARCVANAYVNTWGWREWGWIPADTWVKLPTSAP